MSIEMPRALEERLKATAQQRGYSEDRTRRYVYGTLAKVERHHHSPLPHGSALREHMIGVHREPAEDDHRRNETSEENRHFWLHYGTSGRADHKHRGRRPD